MAYIISHTIPTVPTDLVGTRDDYDVVVSFDSETERFYVLFTATNSGYVVSRDNVIGWDYKYTNCIEERILDTFSADEDDVYVLFTNSADNEVYLIWMANCDIF